MKEATKYPPLCRYCGKPIGKRTLALMCYATPPNTTYIDRYSGQERPIAVPRHVVGVFKTKADLQRVVNEAVVSIRKNDDGTIREASTWDGQSYVSEYFCNGKHATLFAYLMAANGQQTNAYANAVGGRKRA
jgi:hypothetical protein